MTERDKLNRKNAREIQKIKDNAKAAGVRAERIKSGEITAAQALKELCGKTETEKLNERQS